MSLKFQLDDGNTIIDSITVNDNVLPFFDFMSLSAYQTKDTIFLLENTYINLYNIPEQTGFTFKSSAKNSWQKSAGWTCYILSLWARKYPNCIWRIYDNR